MFYDPRTQQHGLPHNPWNALVAPRPIGWISTRSADRQDNLAPYSFFNAISGAPPFVMFSSTPRKNSLTNIEATGVFAVNIATLALRKAMNLSSAPFEPDVDEFARAGLAKASCTNIAAPRVAASPATIECILYDTIALKPKSGLPSQTTLVLGEVVGIHIADDVLVDGRVAYETYQPLGRLGYMDYCAVSDVFEMFRPTPQEME